MAPPVQRRQISKDRFGIVFGSQKSQSYIDPLVRGAPSYFHRTISWNATGTLIATGSTDKVIRLWNPEITTSKSQIELRGHTQPIEKLLFNPTREFELASCASDGTVRFWDTRSKACTTKLEVAGEVFTLSWSVDGTVLVAGTKNDVLFPISTTSTPAILGRHPQTTQTNQTCFSNAYPPGDLLLTHSDGTVSIRSYPSFSTIHTLMAHTSSCTAIAYSPNGKYLAVGGSDALISLWDTTDWVCRRTLSNPTFGAVKGLSWSWDGRFLVGASEDVSSGDGAGMGSGGLEIYHAESGDVVYTVPTGTSGIPAVEWHPSRYWLAYTQIEASTGKSMLKVVGAAGVGLSI